VPRKTFSKAFPAEKEKENVDHSAQHDYSFNFWIGCQKCSEGCRNCYMFMQQERRGLDPTAIKRCTTTWVKPRRWQREAASAGVLKSVFACSYSDSFLPEADAWRDEPREFQDTPKTDGSIRQVGTHPDVAALLKAFIDDTTSGFLFPNSKGTMIRYANLRRDLLAPLLRGRSRKIMKREKNASGWPCAGVEKFPGVLPEGTKGKYGFHSFRRFRHTYAVLEGVPQPIVDFWLGHSDGSIQEVYNKVKQEPRMGGKCGLGFTLPTAKVVAITAAGKNIANRLQTTRLVRRR